MIKSEKKALAKGMAEKSLKMSVNTFVVVSGGATWRPLFSSSATSISVQ
jgi:hypothetical protein